MDLRQIGLGGVDWIRLAQEQVLVAGCCECGDEHSGPYATELVTSLKVVYIYIGVCGQRYAPTALYSRVKDPLYPLYSRLDGPQSRSEHRD
jgi:hypothetical protein